MALLIPYNHPAVVLPSIVTVGARFERLLVLRLEKTSKGRNIWRCRCDCGKHKLVSTRLLTSGTTRSCGCLRVEVARAARLAARAA